MGFKVYSAIANDHPLNVTALSRLYDRLGGEKRHLPSCLCRFKKKSISILLYNSVNQKHQKESAGSKEICILIFSI